jgi:hypothetical protein
MTKFHDQLTHRTAKTLAELLGLVTTEIPNRDNVLALMKLQEDLRLELPFLIKTRAQEVKE